MATGTCGRDKLGLAENSSLTDEGQAVQGEKCFIVKNFFSLQDNANALCIFLLTYIIRETS